MIKFEKVSYEQFKKDAFKNIENITEAEVLEAYNRIELPRRSTSGAAGYDFKTPFKINLDSEKAQAVIPTGVKVFMENSIYLAIYPRSGIGFKTGTTLANTVGIIDSDYHNNESNEGHIMIKLSLGFSDYIAEPGDRIAQGIFNRYYIEDWEGTLPSRSGGFGSTGK